MSRTEGHWRRAAQADAEAVANLLGPLETHSCSLSGRIRRPSPGLLGKTGLALPARPWGLFIHGQENLDAAVLFTGTGTVMAARTPSVTTAPFRALARSKRLSTYLPSVCLGLRENVHAVEEAFDWEASLSTPYVAMALDGLSPEASGTHSSSLTVRRASIHDLDALCPLAAAYEQEEVLTYLHAFDARASKDNQKRSLLTHEVWVAELGKKIVARAQTNARGWVRDQLGGIFVIPEYRGRGYGRAVVMALLSSLLAQGRLVSLFVKEANIPALRLYESLGFYHSGAFSLDYFA